MTDILTKLRSRALRFFCRTRGFHIWKRRDAKRFCATCGREEWLFSKSYPGIGQPAHEWKEMRR